MVRQQVLSLTRSRTVTGMVHTTSVLPLRRWPLSLLLMEAPDTGDLTSYLQHTQMVIKQINMVAKFDFWWKVHWNSNNFHVEKNVLFLNYCEIFIRIYFFSIAPCASNYYGCSNGLCIDQTLRCDSFNQCGDESDEAACTGKKSEFIAETRG